MWVHQDQPTVGAWNSAKRWCGVAQQRPSIEYMTSSETCDPVANRVEAPCLGKNVLAGTNALACANMALADYKHLIPLDEVIYAMNEVGKAIPHELCCTAKGGLSITPTSRAIEQKLASTEKTNN